VFDNNIAKNPAAMLLVDSLVAKGLSWSNAAKYLYAHPEIELNDPSICKPVPVNNIGMKAAIAPNSL
jgi:hypothetical protein